MGTHRTTQFASFDSDGTILALVADGLPEYPADGILSVLTDDEVGALHDALLESATALAEDPEFDPADATTLAERITALRDRGRHPARRRADGPDVAPAAEADPTPTVDPADREAALAALAALTTEAPEVVAPVTADVTLSTGSLISPRTSPRPSRRASPPPPRPSREATLAARPAAPAGRVSARDLGAFAPAGTAPGDGAGHVAPRRGRLVSAGDVPGHAMGAPLETVDDIVAAFQARHRTVGRTSSGVEDEKVVVATLALSDSDIPEGRDLRGLNAEADRGEMKRRIRLATGNGAMGIDPWTREERPIGRGGIAVGNPDALVASGGLAAPVEPYYPQLHVGQAAMPTFDAIPGFTAERGGIRLVSPASLNTLATATVVGAFTDGVSNTDTSFVSATAAFTAADLHQPIIGTDIPAGTYIATVTNGTTVVLSQDTTATATGLAFRLPARNPNNLGPAVGLVTAAQDAAGPPNTVKFTYDVPNGDQVEFDVYSVYTSLQFANLTARTFPEQVELNILLANDLAARVAEQAALDTITAWSTLLTAAKTFGTARQIARTVGAPGGLPAQLAAHGPVGHRPHRPPGLGDQRDARRLHLVVHRRWRQLGPVRRGTRWRGFGTARSSCSCTRTGRRTSRSCSPSSAPVRSTPAPTPPPRWPCRTTPARETSTSFRTKVVSFMWPEGTWLGLTTGELNIGLVRDSVLNSQNRFRNFEERWVTPAFVGSVGSSLRTVHTVAADGTYGAAANITLGVGSGL